MFKLETAARVALAVLLMYAGYLVMLAASLPREIFAPLFSEQGPFEQMSIVLWLALRVGRDSDEIAANLS